MQMFFFLIVGGLAGWFSGNLLEDVRFGPVSNTVIGVFGGILGKWYTKKLGFDGDSVLLIWNAIIIFGSALQLLFLFSLVKKIKIV